METNISLFLKLRQFCVNQNQTKANCLFLNSAKLGKRERALSPKKNPALMSIILGLKPGCCDHLHSLLKGWLPKSWENSLSVPMTSFYLAGKAHSSSCPLSSLPSTAAIWFWKTGSPKWSSKHPNQTHPWSCAASQFGFSYPACSNLEQEGRERGWQSVAQEQERGTYQKNHC